MLDEKQNKNLPQLCIRGKRRWCGGEGGRRVEREDEEGGGEVKKKEGKRSGWVGGAVKRIGGR